MDPSGIAWFLTEHFNVHRLVLTRYIHPYCTGTLRIACPGKWTTKWTITSKMVGGKIFSSLHGIIGYLFSVLARHPTSKFCNIVAERSFLIPQ
jgi:hypothetical protein